MPSRVLQKGCKRVHLKLSLYKRTPFLPETLESAYEATRSKIMLHPVRILKQNTTLLYLALVPESVFQKLCDIGTRIEPMWQCFWNTDSDPPYSHKKACLLCFILWMKCMSEIQ